MRNVGFISEKISNTTNVSLTGMDILRGVMNKSIGVKSYEEI